VAQAAAMDPVWTGAVLTLLGLAAVVARARRPAAGTTASLPPMATWISAAIAFAVTVLITLVPDVAMRLVHIFRV
jgi:hypothetical protein